MNIPLVPLGHLARIERAGVPPDQIKTGTQYVGLEHIDGSGTLKRALVDEGELASTKFAFTSNHVLYGKLRPYLRKIARPDFDGVCSTDIVPINPGPELDRSYLFHFLRLDEVVNKAASLATGVNLPRLNPRLLESFEVPLPLLDEQRRIAAILDQADELRRKRRIAIKRVNQVASSELIKIIATEYPDHKLREVCQKITDGTHQAPTWAPSGVPFIFVSNLRDQCISLETNKFVSDDTYVELTRRTPIEIGDVLYTAVGSYGHSACVSTTDKFVFQRHIAHLKPKVDRFNGTFLSYLLECAALRRQADKAATGLAQKTVTLDALKDFSVPVPPSTSSGPSPRASPRLTS